MKSVRSVWRLLEYSKTRDTVSLDQGGRRGSAVNRPESGYMLKEELLGYADRLDVGEAMSQEDAQPLTLPAHVRCGSLWRPLTLTDKVQPTICSLCMSFGAVSPVSMQSLV